jgi:chromosome segregation ATPase
MSYLVARYWPHILGVLIYTAIVGVLGHAVGEWQGDRRANKAELALAHVQRDAAQQVAMAAAKARQVEQKRANDLAELAAEHERNLRDAQDRSDRVVAGLRAGNVQLRREIAAYATERLSRDSTAPAELSDAAERGAELVGAAVGVGAQCDATQAALIEAYEKLRRPAP